MNQFFFFLTCVCFIIPAKSSLALFPSENVVKQFQPNHEYIFNLNITIDTAFNAPEKSGFPLTAHILVLFENSTIGVLWITNVSMPNEENVIRKIELPIKFYYVNGIVTKFYSHESDLILSRNLKRAVLNLLQINIGEDAFDKPTFKSRESMLEGDCDSHYTLNQFENETSYFNVTKIIDFSSCDTMDKMAFSSETLELKWNKSSIFKYILSGTPKNFGINYAEVISRYSISDAGISYSVTTHTTLAFVSMAQKEFFHTNNSYTENSLRYSFEDLQFQNQFYRNVDAEFNGTSDKLHQIISFLENSGDPFSGNFSNLHIYKVVHLLRQCSLKELKQIWENLNGTHIFIDYLFITGTTNTVQFVLEKARNGEISNMKILQMLLQLSQNPFSDASILENLETFCDSGICQQNEMLRQTCWLSLGSILFQQNANESLSFDQKQKYHQLFTNQLHSSSSVSPKILTLKVMGNAALESSIPILKTIIQNGTEELILRQQAIDSLRRFVPSKFSPQINEILMPIFGDSLQTPPLRMSAFSILLWKFPESEFFEEIEKILFSDEKSDPNLCSFIYTSLKSFKNSKSDEFVVKAGGIHENIDAKKVKLQLSQFQQISAFNESLLATFQAFFDAKSVFPHNSKFRISAFGHQFELHFIQQNLENMLKNLYLSSTDAFAMASFRYNDIDLLMTGIFGNSVETFFNQFLFPKFSEFSAKLIFSLNEKIIAVPTSAGFPIQYSNFMPIVVNINGEINQNQITIKPIVQISRHIELKLLDAPINVEIRNYQNLKINGTWKANASFKPDKIQISFDLPEDENLNILEFSETSGTNFVVFKKQNQFYIKFDGINNNEIYHISYKGMLQKISNESDFSFSESPTKLEISLSTKQFQNISLYTIASPIIAHKHEIIASAQFISPKNQKELKFLLQSQCLIEAPKTCRRISSLTIIDGKYANKGDLPFFARLRSDKGQMANGCGASIVGDRWLITARHCVKFVKQKMKTLMIFTGSIHPQKGFLHTIAAIYYPKNESLYSLNSNEDDIALIKTSKTIKFNEFIKPINLALNEDLSKYPDFVDVAGYGLFNGASMKTTLQTMNILLHPSDACISINKKNQKKEICLGGENASIGIGDTGGAVYLRYPNNTFFQIGVISRHDNMIQPDARDTKFLATFIPFYCDWIFNATDGEVKCKEMPLL